MSGDSAACRAGAETLVRKCARLRAGERAYILANDETQAVAEYVREACRAASAAVDLEVIPPLGIHGAEPPAYDLDERPPGCLLRAHAREDLRALKVDSPLAREQSR